MRNYSLVFLGEPEVGKSAIISQFLDNTFIRKYDATIEDIYRKYVTVNNKMVYLTIADTGGIGEYRQYCLNSYKSADIGIIVYSITDRNSFRDIENVRQLIGKDIPIILVGNKIDREERKVTHDEGTLVPNVSYFTEITARDKEMVDELFQKIVEILVNKEKEIVKSEEIQKKSKCCILL